MAKCTEFCHHWSGRTGALDDVVEIAEKERIAFYDASYVITAKAQNLTLVTEDVHLAKTASKRTKTASAKDIL